MQAGQQGKGTLLLALRCAFPHLTTQVMPNRSTKPLTLPEEPELRVNKRARIHCSEAEQVGYVNEDSVPCCRSSKLSIHQL
jgi:hypothetical protein